MTAITSATSAATTTTSSSSSLSLDSIDFLSLLMTQLTHQDPMDPQDSTEFASQLATYSSLEEQVSMNDTLTTISDTMADVLTQISLLASES